MWARASQLPVAHSAHSSPAMPLSDPPRSRQTRAGRYTLRKDSAVFVKLLHLEYIAHAGRCHLRSCYDQRVIVQAA